MCVFIASLCAVAVAIRWKRALLLDVLVVVYCTVILTVFPWKSVFPTAMLEMCSMKVNCLSFNRYLRLWESSEMTEEVETAEVIGTYPSIAQ